MAYVLGVDLGTTYSAAAIDEAGRTEVFQLGSRAAVIPSVVVLRADGEILTGEAADRRSQSEPTRTAREFKRRLGDPTPLILGGTPYGAESVISLLLKAIAAQVAEQRGEVPSLLCVTHPASYGPYKLDLLRQAVHQADVAEAFFLSEPEAAALHYASQERIEPGTAVAVYDFGGGTFDAAVLRKTESGFELLGQPEGMERLGGIDFDEAIFQHVARALGGKIEELDTENAAAQAGVARLREECQRAKEALSSDTEAVIQVLLPNVQSEVRITRAEFESIIAPRVRETVAALARTVRSAGLAMEQLDRILLVGGTSRIPLVGALVREMTGRPVAVDAHPKHAIALGAALEAHRRLPVGADTESAAAIPEALIAASPAAPVARIAVTVPAASVAAPTSRNGAEAPPEPAPEPNPASPPPASAPPRPPRTRNPILLFGLAGVVVLGLAASAIFVLAGGDNDPAAAPDATSTTQPEPTPTTATDATTQPAATPTLAPNTSRITGIRLANNRYEVDFQVAGFAPNVATQHVHFFFDTVPPQQAGVPGAGPWFVYGGGSPFTGYSPNDRPANATRMCILVANSNHSVIPGTGNCLDLPE